MVTQVPVLCVFFIFFIKSPSVIFGRVRAQAWETHGSFGFTCVFVFVSQQRAALLEDLVAEVAGVHAAVRLLHLLPLRARVGVVLLLHGGHALRVLPLLLGNMTNHRRLGGNSGSEFFLPFFHSKNTKNDSENKRCW